MPKRPAADTPNKEPLRPSNPGFSVDEARELLGMCVVANYLGPVVFAPFPVGLEPTNDPDDPLPNDNGRTYPYPERRIWPKGWMPGVDSGDPNRPWEKSILTSRLSNGVGVNGAIVAYNADRDAYAVAFAGTLNPGAAMQNLVGLLIPAGPVYLDYFQSKETYISEVPTQPVVPAGGQVYPPLPEPPVQIPRVHLGYRQALESLTVGPQTATNNLKTILEAAEGNEIDLYITGHSLGAAVAQLFSAWVRAGGVPGKKINVKCYSFATPKSCNTPMASNYALALGNAGLSYRIDNSLDTAQQLPPTKEESTDLINPEISTDLLSKAAPVGLYAASPLAPLVKMIIGSGMVGSGSGREGVAPGRPGATMAPSATAQPATTGAMPASMGSAPMTAPGAPPIPFPFSIVVGVLKSMAAGPQAGGPSSGAGSPLSGPPAKQPPNGAMPMNFVGIGVPQMLAALPPVVYNGRCYPPEFFPTREAGDLVEIPDMTTRQWWQHWPYNYARYLMNMPK